VELVWIDEVAWVDEDRSTGVHQIVHPQRKSSVVRERTVAIQRRLLKEVSLKEVANEF
jgi:hypothetical protein